MQPVEIQVTAHTSRSPQELCADFLDTDRWSEFSGYFLLPGIKKAGFEVKTTGIVGSRIRVYNTDGSTHIEEIIAWDVPDRIAVKFQEFKPPLAHLATHFVETWEFQRATNGTVVTRSMTMYPKGWLGRIMLLPIAQLMKKAFEKQLNQAQSTRK